MKKSNIQKLLFFVCFFSVLALSAQPRVVSKTKLQFSDCIYKYDFVIPVNYTELYGDPTSYPFMQLNVSIGNNVIANSGPITGLHCSPPPLNQNAYNDLDPSICLVKTSINIDLCGLCPRDGGDYTLQLEIVDSENGQQYPACNYTGSNQLFACQMFAICETDSEEPCDNEGLTTNELNIDCSEVKIPFSEENNLTGLYPNPAREIINLTWSPEAGPLKQYAIRGLDGKIYKSINFEGGDKSLQIEIPLSELTTGLYFIEIKYENKTVIEKFYKQ